MPSAYDIAPSCKRPKDAESNENRKKSKITGETDNTAKALFTEDEEMEDPFISTQPNKQLFDTFNHMLGAPDNLLQTMEYPFLSLQGDGGALDALEKATGLAVKVLKAINPKGKPREELTKTDWLLLFGTLIDNNACKSPAITEKIDQKETHELPWLAAWLANADTCTICGRAIGGKAPASKIAKAWFAAWTVLGSHHIKRKNDKKQARQQTIVEAMKKQAEMSEKPKAKTISFAATTTNPPAADNPSLNQTPKTQVQSKLPLTNTSPPVPDSGAPMNRRFAECSATDWPNALYPAAIEISPPT